MDSIVSGDISSRRASFRLASRSPRSNCSRHPAKVVKLSRSLGACQAKPAEACASTRWRSLRSPQTYAGLLEHALQRAGIPAYFERGTRRPHPTGRAFRPSSPARRRTSRLAGSPNTCRLVRFLAAVATARVSRVARRRLVRWPTAPVSRRATTIDAAPDMTADAAPSAFRAPWRASAGRVEGCRLERSLGSGAERPDARMPAFSSELRRIEPGVGASGAP